MAFFAPFSLYCCRILLGVDPVRAFSNLDRLFPEWLSGHQDVIILTRDLDWWVEFTGSHTVEKLEPVFICHPQIIFIKKPYFNNYIFHLLSVLRELGTLILSKSTNLSALKAELTGVREKRLHQSLIPPWPPTSFSLPGLVQSQAGSMGKCPCHQVSMTHVQSLIPTWWKKKTYFWAPWYVHVSIHSRVRNK